MGFDPNIYLESLAFDNDLIDSDDHPLPINTNDVVDKRFKVRVGR